MLRVLPQELRLVHRPQQRVEEGLGQLCQAALRGILGIPFRKKKRSDLGPRWAEEFKSDPKNELVLTG